MIKTQASCRPGKPNPATLKWSALAPSVAILSREYPPEIYGGAGVAVEYLSRALAELVDVRVHCFGAPRDDELVAAAYEPWDALPSGAPHAAALQTMSVDLRMAADVSEANLVHTHTWYANFGG